MRFNTVFIRASPSAKYSSLLTVPKLVNGVKVKGFCGMPDKKAACSNVRSAALTPKTP